MNDMQLNNNIPSKQDEDSYLSKSNFEHYFRIANMMAKSQMVPKNFIGKPQDVLIAMEYGRSLNLGPLQAVQNICVINSKPSLYGDAVLAVCSGLPSFQNIEETAIMNGKEIIGYTCTVNRRNRSPVTQPFTIDDAKKAGLWGKQGPWTQYPARMLQMRARAFALRDSFADALSGVRIAEEVQDYRETKDITPSNAKSALKDLISKNKQALKEPINDSSVDIDPETGEVIPEL